MISTHILDTSRGVPAEGVRVILERRDGAEWVLVSEGITNPDGRFLFPSSDGVGVFRIQFGIEAYLSRPGAASFFLDLPISFRIDDASRKYHVPLLLSPYGLSSYRGS